MQAVLIANASVEIWTEHVEYRYNIHLLTKFYKVEDII